MNSNIAQVARYLESIAPLHLQEAYDNSGLLIGNRDEIVKGVIVCLDVTEEVIDEAIRMECNLIVSHHPAIFYGMKRLTGSNPTERIVEKAIKSDVAIYSIHTNLDNVLANGVNERIAKELGLTNQSVLRPLASVNEEKNKGAGILASFSEPVAEVIFLQLLGKK